MKIILSASIFLAFLLTSSCVKNNDDNTVHGLGAIAPNSWVMGRATFKATNVQATSGQLKGTQINGTQVSTFTVLFNGPALPATKGNFKIVAANPGLNEVVVKATDGSTGITYTATGNGDVYASVYNTTSSDNNLGNYIGVSIPAVWAKTSIGATDSIAIHGSLARQ